MLNVWNGCCVGRVQTARTFVLFVRVIAFEAVIDWCLIQYELAILPISLSKCTTMAMMALRASIFVCLMYVTMAQLNSMYVLLLRLSSNLAVVLVFDAVWGRKRSSSSSCVAQIHFNGAGDSVLIYVRQTRVVYWP